MSLSWSKPYFGYQHLSGVTALDGDNHRRSGRTHQITVCSYSDSTVVAYVLALGSSAPFTAWKEETFNTIADAMAWGEEQARNL